MGEYSLKCNLTGLPITPGAKVLVVMVASNYINNTHLYGVTDKFLPICLPFVGTYNGCGGIEKGCTDTLNSALLKACCYDKFNDVELSSGDMADMVNHSVECEAFVLDSKNKKHSVKPLFFLYDAVLFLINKTDGFEKKTVEMIRTFEKEIEKHYDNEFFRLAKYIQSSEMKPYIKPFEVFDYKANEQMNALISGDKEKAKELATILDSRSNSVFDLFGTWMDMLVQYIFVLSKENISEFKSRTMDYIKLYYVLYNLGIAFDGTLVMDEYPSYKIFEFLNDWISNYLSSLGG